MGSAIAVDAGGFNFATLVIFVEHMIAGAFYKLLTENIAEKEIVQVL